jgi:hypothetical protein
MDWLIFAIGMVAGVLVFEFFKHYVVRKSGKFIVIGIVILVLFIIFSAVFVNTDTFKDSSFIKTGAAIADVFSKNTGDVTKDTLSKSSSLFNSTFKKE